MQVELLEAKTADVRPFGAAEVRGDVVAVHLVDPSTGLAYDPAGLCGLEFCPFLVLRHEIPAAGHR